MPDPEFTLDHYLHFDIEYGEEPLIFIAFYLQEAEEEIVTIFINSFCINE